MRLPPKASAALSTGIEKASAVLIATRREAAEVRALNIVWGKRIHNPCHQTSESRQV